MSDDTLGINLTLDEKETEALSRALTAYADYHEILAAEVAHEVLTPSHQAWANYYTDLATTVRGGQTHYDREDLTRISEALDQYSRELPLDLQSVDTTVRDLLYRTRPSAHHSNTAIQHSQRSRETNPPTPSSHYSR